MKNEHYVMKMNETDNELTFIQKIAVEILWTICRGFAMLPYFMRHYVLGPIFYFTLRYPFPYRRRVILTNLRNSFPAKTEKELKPICAFNYDVVFLNGCYGVRALVGSDFQHLHCGCARCPVAWILRVSAP